MRPLLVVPLTMTLLVPLASAAGSPQREPHREIPLRNWIPATSSQLPVLRNGQIAATALPSAASHFIALAPCRVVDTRGAENAHGGPIITGGVSRAFNIPAGPCSGIPAAAAYSLNIAVTGSAPGSIHFLTAYPAGVARPTTATMNFDGGETTSNAALVPADASGAIEIYASTDVHVIVDINGYLREGVVTSVTTAGGLSGGGTGAVTVQIAPAGVGSAQLGANAVTSGAISGGAVDGSKIANNQIVRSVNSVRDAVTIAAGSGASVNTAGSTITIAAAPPIGTFVLGNPGDTTLIAAGFSETGPSGVQSWRATSTTGAPSARRGPAAVWTGTRMVVWGGTSTSGPANTGGQYDPVTNSWTPTASTGAPSARSNPAEVWTGTRMIIWGGFGTTTATNTGARYDPLGDSWLATSTIDAPVARSGHTGIWTGATGLMVIWGGAASASVRLSTGARYNAAADSWTPTAVLSAPTARSGHTATWDGSRMVVWGGFDGAYTSTGGRYDPAANSWASTSLTGAPAPRGSHSSVLINSGAVAIWGGSDEVTRMQTGAKYQPATDVWTNITTSGAPAGRYTHTAVWTGRQMVIFGGTTGSAGQASNSGGLYDPVTDTWSALSTNGVPSARQHHSAVWTGSEMIVWGGFEGSVMNSGGHWAELSLYRKN